MAASNAACGETDDDADKSIGARSPMLSGSYEEAWLPAGVCAEGVCEALEAELTLFDDVLPPDDVVRFTVGLDIAADGAIGEFTICDVASFFGVNTFRSGAVVSFTRLVVSCTKPSGASDSA